MNGSPDNVQLLIELLENISREANRLLAGRPRRTEDVQKVLAYTVEIRGLLALLSRASRLPDDWTPLKDACPLLADRYLDLEGRLKELRNDLVREDGVRQT